MSETDAIIEAFGGVTALAERLNRYRDRPDDLAAGAVMMWRQREHIPWKWRGLIVRAAREDEITLDEDWLLGIAAKRSRGLRARASA